MTVDEPLHGGYVVGRIAVVVAEKERVDHVVAHGHVALEHAWIAYAGHKHRLRAGIDLLAVGLLEQRPYRQRTCAREIYLLECYLFKLLAPDALVERRHVVGTLRDDEVVCGTQPRRDIAQRSCRQHFVARYRTRRVDYDDIDLGRDAAVLKPVVHDYKVDLGVFAPYAPYALGALLANDDRHIGEFELYLQRLVARVEIRRRTLHFTVALRAAAVTAREKRDVVAVAQMRDDILRRRGLARTADGNVAHAHDRYVERLALEYMPVVETMPQRHRPLVEP